jgi:hypothetical protein
MIQLQVGIGLSEGFPTSRKHSGLRESTEKSAKPGLVIPACPESFFAVIRN